MIDDLFFVTLPSLIVILLHEKNKKQGVVAHSNTKLEFKGMDFGLKHYG
jgi:hypothetical protein